MTNTETKMGILGGVCFSVVGQFGRSILETIVLAALGAVVSFVISRVLQWLVKRRDV